MKQLSWWLYALSVGHYEILGVDQHCSVDEIKRAYLALARREHPDLHNETPESRLHAENRMRAINAAWTVLSDPDERAFYDRKRLGVNDDRRGPESREATAQRSEWAANRPSPDWAPFDSSASNEEFDERHDRPITSGALPGWLAVAPVISFAYGLVAVSFGSFIGFQLLALSGIAAMLSSILLFLAAPLVALGRSRRGDRLG